MLVSISLNQSFEELLATGCVWQRNIKFFDKTSSHCLIEVIRPICGSNYEDASLFSSKGICTVQLNQELSFYSARSFLVLIVACTQEGINLINEHNRRLMDSCNGEHGSDHFFTLTNPL